MVPLTSPRPAVLASGNPDRVLGLDALILGSALLGMVLLFHLATAWSPRLPPGPGFLLQASPLVLLLVAHFMRSRTLPDPERDGILTEGRAESWILFILVIAGPKLTEVVFGHAGLYLPTIGLVLGASFLLRARELKDRPQTAFAVGVLALAALLAVLQPEVAVAGTALAGGMGLSLLAMGTLRLRLRPAPRPPAARE